MMYVNALGYSYTHYYTSCILHAHTLMVVCMMQIIKQMKPLLSDFVRSSIDLLQASAWLQASLKIEAQLLVVVVHVRESQMKPLSMKFSMPKVVLKVV